MVNGRWIILVGCFLLTGCLAPGSPGEAGSDLTACIPPGQTAVEADVVHVSDGDTIIVRVDGEEQRLRYIGINAPEMGSETQAALAEQAYQLNCTLVADQSVLLLRDTSETDQYERLLRYVLVGDTFVNYELVRRGMARAHGYPPDTACSQSLEEAERLAREEDLGIWAGR